MLYTRTSFLKYLKEKHDCEIIPLRDKRVLRIKHGPATYHMWLHKYDRIDYEEIFIAYQKLYLPDLPGEKDLERIE